LRIKRLLQLHGKIKNMAGDWIKIEQTTPDKPEIIRMAELLKLDSDSVVGKLVRIWVWADLNSVDGNAITVTEAFLDKLTHKRGFAAAMRVVGWLAGDEGALNFPGFERHNGKSAKARAGTKNRVEKHRKSNGGSVTKALPEKSRVEKNTATQCTPLPPRGDEFSLEGEKVDLAGIVGAYPRREGVAEALNHVAASVRKGADLAAILTGTRAIAAVIVQLPSGHLNAFVVSAGTFFKNERWRDDPQTWLRHGAAKNGAAAGSLNLGGRKVGSMTRIVNGIPTTTT